jgi:enolase
MREWKIMVNFEISKVKARWILDSRGNPTVEVDLWAGDEMARAAVPSGASTGEFEAVELRDEGKIFMGKHVLKAVSNVNDIISKSIIGFDCTKQKELDDLMIRLDGTPNKAKLGANAILAVSMAAAKLAAKLMKKPLYGYFYELAHGGKNRGNYLMPIPSSNVLNGGKHAGGNLAIQEFMILPVGAKTFSQSIQMITEVYHNMRSVIKRDFGVSSINVGDEGGFAPALNEAKQALDIIMEAIQKAGYIPDLDVVLGLDAAASSFYDTKSETYNVDGQKLKAEELVDYYVDLCDSYPLKSVEDPFYEEDYKSFAALTKKIGNKVQIVDDDLTVTNVKRLQKAIDMGAGNTLLLKVNQIGSITEAISAANLSYKNNFRVFPSHRSGETCDNTLADLAVGLCSGFIKTGAPCRSDRNSKYNQLLRIEEELGSNALYPKTFDDWKAFQ